MDFECGCGDGQCDRKAGGTENALRQKSTGLFDVRM